MWINGHGNGSPHDPDVLHVIIAFEILFIIIRWNLLKNITPQYDPNNGQEINVQISLF